MKLNSLSYTRTGSALLTIEMDRAAAESIMEDFQNVDVDVTIKKHSEKRSLDANAYAWVLIGKLAQKIGQNRTDIYRAYIREIGVSDTVCVRDRAVDKLRESWESHGIGWITDTMPSKITGCTNVILYYGSSTYDSSEMSRLIETIIYDCKENNIPTETPAQINEMISRWGERLK